MIKVWYQDSHPEIWEKITNLSHDATPETCMMCWVLEKAVSEKLMIDQNSQGFYQSFQLDKLKIPSIEVFPDSMKPNKFAIRFKSETLEKFPVMEAIEKKMCKMSSGAVNTIFSPDKFDIPGIPMAMYKQQYSSYYRPRIITTSNTNHYKDHITKKMNFLVWYLNMCHNQVICLLNSKRINPVRNAMDEFNKWFSKVLFSGTQDNCLPIFGDVDIEEYKSKGLTFDKVQVYLINEYLSPHKSYTKVVQVSLALICYWYQTFHPNSFFKRDQEYWKYTIESLSSMMSHQGKYTLRYFDPQGNWTGRW
jgi:hypothetical protein